MKKLPLHKHFFLLFLALILNLSAVTDLYGDDALKNSELIFIGEDDAPVEIKVFSSLTCPHCANFHINVISKIKGNASKTVQNNKMFAPPAHQNDIIINYTNSEEAFGCG